MAENLTEKTKKTKYST